LKYATLLILLALLALGANAAEPGLAAVTDLGQANGQALACKDKDAAARAKSLMLRYAPRTQRYGEVFEQATQQGFLAQVKAQSACPEARALAERMDGIAKQLRESLPQILPE